MVRLQQKTIEKVRSLINEETEYRSGPKLVAFFNYLGFQDSYGQGFPSRWMYTDERLEKINGTDKMEVCLTKLFSPVNFIGRFDVLDKLIADLNDYLSFDGYKIKRNGKIIEVATSTEDITLNQSPTITEDEFLGKEFDEVSINSLGFDAFITIILEQRLNEIKKCLVSKAALATIFLCGSTLEGIFLGIAIGNPMEFNKATASPKDKNGKVLQFQDWTLSNFIDVAKEIGLIQEDVKKFSHSLRSFRNYIHPYEQLSQQFNPNEHTARLCCQVLKLATFQMVLWLNR